VAVTAVTATIEALVGTACLAMGWACWQRGTLVFRIVAVALAIAGVIAVGNALVSFT
jgi:hypothetical protein